MNDKLQNILADLAEKFGTTVDHLWTIMVRQAMISGIMDIINILFILGVTVVYSKFLIWYLRNQKDLDDNEFMYGFLCPLVMILGGVGTIMLIGVGLTANIYDLITAFGNPEYWALHQIIK